MTAKARIFRLDDDATDRGFDEADLDRLVENFNARKQGSPNDIPAPWHLGHEDDRKVEQAFLKSFVKRTDLPALATPNKVWREGKELWSEVTIPTIALPLHQLYPQRSAEIYRDYRGQGPTLKGVGMLGATQPAKKGLGAVVLNDEAGGEYVVATPVAGLERFMDGATATTPQTELGALILSKVQAVAAADEGKTTDSVLQEVAQAAGLDSAGFMALLSGQSTVELSDEQAAAMANVLGVTMDEIKAAAGLKPTGDAPADAPADDQEVAKMSEPKIQPVSPEKFAELQQTVNALKARDTEKDELLKAQRAEIAKLQAAKATEQAERFSERITNVVERDFLSTGRISPAHKEALTGILKRASGLEQFAEGQDPLTATIEVLAQLLPAKAESGVRRPPTPRAADVRIQDVVTAFQEQQRLMPHLRFESFAENVGALSAEDIAKGKALLPESK